MGQRYSILKTRNYISLIIWILITSALFVYTINYQQTADYDQCLKCDGKHYLKAYHYFNGDDEKYEVIFPINNRVFVPYLAALVGFEEPISNFLTINFLYTILSVVFIFILWRQLKIPSVLMNIGLFWLIFHWVGIIRLNVLDPITVDLPLYLFHAILVYIVYRNKYFLLPILSIIATSQKESFIVYILILLIYGLIHNRIYEKHFPIKLISLSLVLAFMTKAIIVYFFPPVNEDINSFIAVLFYVKQILLHPFSLVRWVVAIFTSFGALFLLSLQNAKRAYKFSPEFNMLSVLTLVSLALGIIAGGDFTRIVFLGFPFIMTWMLIVLKEKSKLVSGLAIVLSIPMMRLFNTIPIRPSGSLTHEWYMEIASTSTVLIWGLYMIVCYWILLRATNYLKG